jgi:hypothetical protein
MRFIVEEVYKVDTNAESRDTQVLHWDDEVWLTVRFYYRNGDIRGAAFDTDEGKCFEISGHENTTLDPGYGIDSEYFVLGIFSILEPGFELEAALCLP